MQPRRGDLAGSEGLQALALVDFLSLVGKQYCISVKGEAQLITVAAAALAAPLARD